MELRDYLRMLRRGWPTVLLVTALAVGLAAIYLTVAPKRYEATAVIFVSANQPDTITDLQQANQFAVNAAATYAEIAHSATVLAPVAEQLRPSRTVEQLEEMVTTGRRESTSLIDVTASASSAAEAANVANATAASAVKVIPALTPQSGSGTRSLVDLQVVRSAPEPSTALSPDTSRVLAIGLIAGLALGLGLTITSQALDTRLRRPEDLRHLTKLPLLAVLPRLRRSQRDAIVVRDDPASAAVESYRSLRTNLSYLESAGRRSLLFTGVADDRHSVQVPVNLAWSMAQSGRSVLLVDLDLRQSSVGEILHLTSQAGMADVLAGTSEMHDVIHETAQPGLHVALAGTTQPSPSDLLSTPRMEAVLRLAERDYDYVVLHAPPILTYTDAAVVARAAGQTLVTVSAAHTRAVELTSALVALGNVRVEPLGLVLVGSRVHVGDINKVRGIWTRRPPTGGVSQGRRVEWDWADRPKFGGEARS
ncbi:polysaccharide biosynthesis tyrosine autokinase [uncultured Friedmanniella sp.]|uniref:polysaccharide biosynthesis tyrosine autokinase n=1 Tax=uncultured Friedmanniella sp. TaxID=335381 RepID=UPI0035CC8A4E